MDKNSLDCPYPGCFFCVMKEANPSKRRTSILKFFKELPSQDDEGQVLAISGLWNTAMAHPNDPEFVDLGIFECMSALISKGLKNRRWLAHDQNIYIPYYAAHIIGSYTMNMEEFAERAVQAGVIPPLVELLRGRLTWVEQRVAVRALGHLATYDSTFTTVASHGEVLELSMQLALSSLEIVYTHFYQFVDRRLSYHCDLLTRGMGGLEMESRKAEEWASQLQCWSLQLINCFAFKSEFLPVICKPDFLVKLPGMWGGLVNENSPAGIGLLRAICHHKLGRAPVANCPSIIEALCNIARSSDDWQYMAVDCLLWLLQDSNTRHKVLLEVARAKNLKVNGQGKGKGKGSVFVRIISSQGCVPLNTREVEASSKPQWAEPLWLRCRGRGRAKPCNLWDELRSQFVVFELRLRSTRPFSSWISTGRRSELLGRVRISWQDVLDSPTLSIESWFPLMLAERREDCSSNPPPSLHIAISAQCGYVDELMLQKNAGHRQLLERDDCACRGKVCSGSHDYNIL